MVLLMSWSVVGLSPCAQRLSRQSPPSSGVPMDVASGPSAGREAAFGSEAGLWPAADARPKALPRRCHSARAGTPLRAPVGASRFIFICPGLSWYPVD